MLFDPDAERGLELVRLSKRPPYEALTPPEARVLFLAGREVLSPQPPRPAVPASRQCLRLRRRVG